jgi:hypothetical protein
MSLTRFRISFSICPLRSLTPAVIFDSLASLELLPDKIRKLAKRSRPQVWRN